MLKYHQGIKFFVNNNLEGVHHIIQREKSQSIKMLFSVCLTTIFIEIRVLNFTICLVHALCLDLEEYRKRQVSKKKWRMTPKLNIYAFSFTQGKSWKMNGETLLSILKVLPSRLLSLGNHSDVNKCFVRPIIFPRNIKKIHVG